MAGSFDPYHKWLGISPKDQPPNHYRLLGIELFEADPDVIESAADQRMAHVRTFQAGQNSAESQRLLNELSAAKLCLLDPQKKTAYDGDLRRKLKPASAFPVGGAPVVAAPTSRPLPQPPVEAGPIVVSDGGAGASHRLRRKRPAWQQPAVLGAAGAVLILAVVAYVAATRVPKNVATGPATAHATNVPKSDAPQPRGDRRPDARTSSNVGSPAEHIESLKPATSDTRADDSKPGPASQARPDEAVPALSLVADASRRPQTPGVIADHVVIWNQHNGDAKDAARGSAISRYGATGARCGGKTPLKHLGRPMPIKACR